MAKGNKPVKQIPVPKVWGKNKFLEVYSYQLGNYQEVHTFKPITGMGGIFRVTVTITHKGQLPTIADSVTFVPHVILADYFGKDDTDGKGEIVGRDLISMDDPGVVQMMANMKSKIIAPNYVIGSKPN